MLTINLGLGYTPDNSPETPLQPSQRLKLQLFKVSKLTKSVTAFKSGLVQEEAKLKDAQLELEEIRATVLKGCRQQTTGQRLVQILDKEHLSVFIQFITTINKEIRESQGNVEFEPGERCIYALKAIEDLGM